MKTSYCPLCGAQAGTSHEPWCPSNDDITHRKAHTMLTAEPAPGLTITEKMYDLVQDALAEHAPEVTLTWPTFTSTAWTRVPDEHTGEAYKAQLELYKTPTRTIYVTRWFTGDIRDPGGPRPHNHPWDFHSVILSGSYVEDRYLLEGEGEIDHAGVEHKAGDTNRIGREEFHEVVDVDPSTLTLMLCGPGMAPWGYLNTRTGRYEQNLTSQRFLEQMHKLNPQQH